MSLSFTERKNPLAASLDGALLSSTFLRTLRACDAQIFSGFEGEECLFDYRILQGIETISQVCANIIDKQDGCIVFGGCGTSGRVAYLVAERFNRILGGAKAFSYCCAGGDSALLLSDELPEDSPVMGIRDFCAAIEKVQIERQMKLQQACYVAITCGLSAPYCAGPIAATLFPEHLAFKELSGLSLSTGLIGFNPVNLARNVTISQLQELTQSSHISALSTFRDIVIALYDRCEKQHLGCHLINPVLGPEPVTGGSRMKGGSATMVILDTICLSAMKLAGKLNTENALLYPLASCTVADILHMYQTCHSQVYMAASKALPSVMDDAANSLKHHGRIYYLGVGSAGALGCIDASEMPDTYGAPFDQTRGFVEQGWVGLRSNEGDISHMSYLHRISFDHFAVDIIPSITELDSVVVLLSAPEFYSEEELQRLVEIAQLASRKNCLLQVVCASFTTQSNICRDVPTLLNLFELVENRLVYCQLKIVESSTGAIIKHIGFTDFAIKIVTNAITTFAQAKGRGAVYKSLMISTGPANDKIYMRCVHMIAETMHITLDEAELCLVRSIYGLDQLPDNFLAQKTREDHIRAGILPADQRHQSQCILPVAFVLASDSSLTVTAARAAVAKEPCISILLQNIVEQRSKRLDLPSAVPVAANMSSVGDFVVGIDLGGTHIRGAAIDCSTAKYISDIVRRTITDRSVEGVMKVLEELYVAVLSSYDNKSGSSGRTPIAVGVGQPGCVHEDGSISNLANFSNWGSQRVPIAKVLFSLRRGVPKNRVFVFDDAASALQAELLFGCARLSASAAMITIGTGLGVAFSVDGKTVYRGSRGLLEGGHSIACSDSLVANSCPCGQFNCLETFCSASAIARFGSPEQLFESEATSEEAKQLISQLVEYASIAVINTIRFYDSSVVILAGGLSARLYHRILACIKTKIWHLHDDLHDIPIVLASTTEPGVLGAAGLAMVSFDAVDVQHQQRPASHRSKPYLRQAIESDRHGLYNVCLKTGDAGADATHLYSVPDLLGSIYVGPYLSHSTKFAFSLVSGESGALVGYTLGVLDTLQFDSTCSSEWWPALIERYRSAEYFDCLHQNEQQLVQQEILNRADASSANTMFSNEFYAKYPSHMHIDMLPEYQGNGYGGIMVNRLLHALRVAGSCGVHLCMHSSNSRAFHFYTTKLGFQFIMKKNEEEWILAREL